MADLYLMCGIPGAGKSTFLKNAIKIDPSFATIVSRDAIRFAIVKPEEDYFSHENEVLKVFWKKINESLAAGKDTFVDQTSLTLKSRKLLLQHVKGYTHANLIWVKEDLKTCLERNELRKGTRAYVPRNSICRMYNQFVEPSINESFDRIFCYTQGKITLVSCKGGLA